MHTFSQRSHTLNAYTLSTCHPFNTSRSTLPFNTLLRYTDWTRSTNGLHPTHCPHTTSQYLIPTLLIHPLSTLPFNLPPLNLSFQHTPSLYRLDQIYRWITSNTLPTHNLSIPHSTLSNTPSQPLLSTHPLVIVLQIGPDLQMDYIQHIAHLTSRDYANIPADLVKLGFVPTGMKE